MYITFPVSISYNSIPVLHQSASLLWPLDCKISGAMYSVVPHIEFDLLNSSISLASPKSVSITWDNRQIQKLGILSQHKNKSRCIFDFQACSCNKNWEHEHGYYMSISIHENIFGFKISMHDPTLVKMWNRRNNLSSIKPCLILTIQDIGKNQNQKVANRQLIEFLNLKHRIPEYPLAVKVKEEMTSIYKIQDQIKLRLCL